MTRIGNGSRGLVVLTVFFLTTFWLHAQQKTKVIVGYWGSIDEQAVTNEGGSVIQRLDGIHAVAADMPSEKIKHLRAKSNVKYVEPDAEATTLEIKGSRVKANQVAQIQAAQYTPWNIIRVTANQSWPITTGIGRKVAIVDTGIYYSHPDLAGNVNSGPSFIRGTKSSNDDNGHGTHVSGTVAAVNNAIGVIGVAFNAKLWGVKVLDRSGSGTYSQVISGINWAASNGMNLINMSLGGSFDSQALHDACDSAVGKGVLISAAAGNSGDTTPEYPGAYPSVVCVSAIDSSNLLASFSTRGPQVDLAAPGVAIASTVPPDSYATWSGTSMATPHVTGCAALVWAANPTLTNIGVRNRLQSKAYDLGTPGVDDDYGYGLVKAYNALTP